MLTSFFVLACQHGSHVSSARPLLLRIQVVQSGPGASQAPVICRKSLAILSWFRIAPRPSHEVSKNFIFIFKNLINILYYFFKIVCFRHCFPYTVYVNWKRLLQHCVSCYTFWLVRFICFQFPCKSSCLRLCLLNSIPAFHRICKPGMKK